MLRQLICLTTACCIACAQASAPDPGAPRTYLVKLSVPVATTRSKPGDRISAAIISPESLLNGYLESIVEAVSSKPAGRLLLRFHSVLYKGKSARVTSEVIEFVNSKGHKSVDDDERPIRLENGALLSTSTDLWLDEGAELRVRAAPAQK